MALLFRSDAVTSADADGLFVLGKRLFSTDDVSHAFVYERSANAFVRFKLLTGDVIDVGLSTDTEGHELLAKMRLDAHNSSAVFESFRAAAPPNWGPAGCAVLVMFWAWLTLVMAAASTPVILVLGSFASMVTTGIVAMLVNRVSRMLASQRLIAIVKPRGVDIRVRNRSLKNDINTFVPIADIASADFDVVGEFEIKLKTGKIIALAAAAGSVLEEQRAFASRLRDLMRARHHARSPLGSLVARGGRTTVEWLDSLRQSAASNVSFRTRALPQDDLWALVESADSSDAARAGAAVVLSRDGDDESRERLAKIAKSCDTPHLRVAIEASIRDTTEKELADALSVIDDDEDPETDEETHSPADEKN